MIDDMTIDEIREQFAIHCGSGEKYRQFVAALNLGARAKGRFFYWQQRLWDSFSEHYPQFAGLSFDEICSIFRICHVHLMDLTSKEIIGQVVPGLIDIYTNPESDKLRYERFPYGTESPIRLLDDGTAKADKRIITVDHCDACYEEMKRHRR